MIRSNNRGNRGISLGFSGNQGCYFKDAKEKGILEPRMMSGTERYRDLFVKMTCLTKLMTKDARFPAPFIKNKNLNGQSKHFASQIHPFNKIEGIYRYLLCYMMLKEVLI